MNVTDLEYLLVVAERRNVGRAAEALGLSQPALTRAIRRLETLAGQDLFVRHARGVDPTPAGLSLIARARRIHGEYADAVRELQDMKAGKLGRVRLGYSPSVDERLITAACRRLLAERPAARLTLSTAFMKPLLERLADGALDLVVGPASAGGAGKFAAEVIYRDSLACVADREHPLHRQAKVGLADIAEEGWLLPSRELPVRLDLEARLAKAGLPAPKVRIESDHITAAQFRLLRGTRLLALAKGEALRGLQRMGLEPVKVHGLTLVREVAVVRRAAAYASPLSKRLRKLLSEAAQAR